MRLTSLAKPLGWFSLALGAAELLAPRRIAAAHGVPEGKNVVRGFGAREIAAGAAVLARPRSSVPFLARAAIALGSLAFVTGALALDLLVARSLARA
jgi:hypothetical protein